MVILAGPSARSLDEDDIKTLKSIMQDIESEGYEFVIIDSAPGVDRSIFPILDVSDEILIVTNPEIPAVTDAKRILSIVKREGTDVVGIELNRVSGKRHELSVVEVESICDCSVITTIRESVKVQRSIAVGRPIVLTSPFCSPAVNFKKMAAGIAGETYSPRLSDMIRWYITYVSGAPYEVGSTAAGGGDAASGDGTSKAPGAGAPVISVRVRPRRRGRANVRELAQYAEKLSKETVEQYVRDIEIEAIKRDEKGRIELEGALKRIGGILSTLDERYNQGIISDEMHSEIKGKLVSYIKDRHNDGVIPYDVFKELMVKVGVAVGEGLADEAQTPEAADSERESPADELDAVIKKTKMMLEVLKKQYEKGTISENTYKELKEKNEGRLRELNE